MEEEEQQLKGQLSSFNLQEASKSVELSSCLPDEV